MDNSRAIELIRARVADLKRLAPDDDAPKFIEWREKSRATLRRIFGDEHRYAIGLDGIWFSTMTMHPSPQEKSEAFASGRAQATAILETAVYELTELAGSEDLLAGSAIDPELWEHVQQLVETEKWDQVASQAAIFLEDRVRKWAGRPKDEVGVNLMNAVLGLKGEFQLGQTDGERQGWLAIGRGISQALRNVDAHRIQRRDDHKRYAIGVLGTVSLTLTQLRYEHGNRFHQT